MVKISLVLLLTIVLSGCEALKGSRDGTNTAAPLEVVSLPKPETKGGLPLMDALSQRKSTREFGSRQLEPQVLSNLLWAASGVNRADGRRTAPSASNRGIVEVYPITADGIYRYNPKEHSLEMMAKGDFRGAAGYQEFVAAAPLNLVYVADYSRMTEARESTLILYSGAETGYMSENVYLFCASQGLNTVIRSMIYRDALAKAMKLRSTQRITLSQTVGYAKQVPSP